MQPKAGQLGQPLSPQGQTKIGVALTHDGQHGLAEHRTQSPIAPPGLREIRPSAPSARKACGSRYIWSSPDANQPLASATDRRPSATLISTSRASALATHRDHRHATPPRQASRRPRSVTSLSVRPVTFLSVIYNRLSRRVLYGKITLFRSVETAQFARTRRICSFIRVIWQDESPRRTLRYPPFGGRRPDFGSLIASRSDPGS